MQNDVGTEGGAFDRAGIDISAARRCIEPTARVLGAARDAGIPIAYLKMAFRPDLSDAGSPDAPNWLKHLPLGGIGTVVPAPDGSEGRILIRDTWNTEIVSELAPGSEDVVLYKHRYSGFYGTHLDEVLRQRGVEGLVFTGWTTSVCVESTVRDAMFRDYTCVLLEDCVGEPIGAGFPRSNHEATLLVLQLLFAWVSDSSAFLRALAAPATAAATAP